MTAPRDEGWHHDPETGRFRYWTGAGWDDEPAGAPTPAPPMANASAPATAASSPFAATPSPGAAPMQATAPVGNPASAAAAGAPMPLRDIRGWAVALIVAGGAIIWLGIGAVSALPLLLGGGLFAGGSDDAGWFTYGDPTGEPPIQQDAVLLNDAVPAGWETVTSPSGRMTFAVDPAWEAMGGDDPASFSGVPEDDLWELAGSWVTDDGGYLTITATHDYTFVWPLQEDAQWYMDPAGSYESTTVEERAVTTETGYAGYEMIAQADDAGYAFEECVLVLDTGSSSIYVYAQSESPALACADLMRPVAQSIAVS